MVLALSIGKHTVFGFPKPTKSCKMHGLALSKAENTVNYMAFAFTKQQNTVKYMVLALSEPKSIGKYTVLAFKRSHSHVKRMG